MSTDSARRVRLAPMLALALLAAPFLGAADDAEEAFRKGVTAFDGGHWDEAVSHLRNALAQRRDSNDRVRLFGMRFEDYTPSLYLGLALSHAGGCPEAARLWDGLELAGLPRSGSQKKILKEGRDRCASAQGPVRVAGGSPPPSPTVPPRPEPSQPTRSPSQSASPGRPAEVQTPSPSAPVPSPSLSLRPLDSRRAEAALAKGEAQLRDVRSLANDPKLKDVWSREERLGRRQAEAEQLLQKAGERIAQGKTSRDTQAFDEAERGAQQASSLLDGVLSAGAEIRSRPPSAPAPPPPALPAPELGRARALLVAGAEAYFGGKYGDAEKALSDAEALVTRPEVAPKLRGQALLLRAASRFALYRLGGASDGQLLARVRADLEAYRAVDAAGRPDPALFPPALLALLK